MSDPETPADKLRMLATWLVEDSDLPEDEARDFAEAIDAVLEELEGEGVTGDPR